MSVAKQVFEWELYYLVSLLYFDVPVLYVCVCLLRTIQRGVLSFLVMAHAHVTI